MKKTISVLMASMMLMLANSATAWDDSCCFYEDPCCDNSSFYVGGFGGANFVQTTKDHGFKPKFDTGYVLAASIGYRWEYNLRFEFEYGYRRNQSKRHSHRHLTTNSYLFNGFWDIPWCNDWNLKPFLGAGIGYAKQRASTRHGHGLGSKKGFAWQLIAGVAYPICDIADVSIEYRFFKGRANHIFNHAVGAGLKYYF